MTTLTSWSPPTTAFPPCRGKAPAGPAAGFTYRDVKPGFLPQGFLDIDMSIGMKLKLHDSTGSEVHPELGFYPKRGSLLGPDPAHPQVVIAPNGGTDLIYLPGPDAKALAPRVVEFLTPPGLHRRDLRQRCAGPDPRRPADEQDWPDRVGATPQPSIVVSFRSWSTGCADPEMCGAEIADSGQQQGQGIHGSFAARTPTTSWRHRPGLQNPLRRPGAGQQRRLGQHARPHPRPAAFGQRPGQGPGDGRGAGRRRTPAGDAADRRAIRNRGERFVTVLNAQEAAGKTYFDAAGMPAARSG